MIASVLSPAGVKCVRGLLLEDSAYRRTKEGADEQQANAEGDR